MKKNITANIIEDGTIELSINIVIKSAASKEEAWDAAHEAISELGTFSTQEDGEEGDEPEEEAEEKVSAEEEEEPEEQEEEESAEGLLAMKDIIAATKSSEPTIYKHMNEGFLGKPVRIKNKNWWSQKQLDDYIKNKPEPAPRGRKPAIVHPAQEEELGIKEAPRGGQSETSSEEAVEKDELLTIDRVSFLTGLEAETIEILVSKNKFPEPDGDNFPDKWRKSDVDEYIADRNKRMGNRGF